MSAVPTVAVKIAYGQSVADAWGSLTWTDVTTSVRLPLSFERGRATVGAAATPGTLSLTFDNSTGLFTPGFSGLNRPRLPIRVTAGGGTFLWLGFITDWSWQAASPTEVTATVQASDILATADRIECSAWIQGTMRTLATPPYGYWPLDDPAGTWPVVASGLTGGRKANLVDAAGGGQWEFGVESDLMPDPAEGTVAAVTPGIGSYTFLSTAATAGSSGRITVSMWIWPSDEADMSLFLGFTSDVVAGAWLEYSADAYNLHSIDGINDRQHTTRIPLYQWTHILIQISAGGGSDTWINGSEDAGSVASSPYTQGTMAVGDKMQLRFGMFLGVGGFSGQLAHVATYDYHPSAGDIALISNRGDDEPTACERLAQLWRVIPVGFDSSWIADAPAGDRSLPVTAQTTATKTVLAVAQELADTDPGVVMAQRDGRLSLQSVRDRHIGMVTSPVEFDARKNVSMDGAFAVDDAELATEATVTNQPSGAVYTAKNSVDVYGPVTATFQIWSAEPGHPESHAEAAVRVDPTQPNSPSVVISMTAVAATDLGGIGDLTPSDILNLDIGDRITIANMPAGAPDISDGLTIENISHNIDGNDWTVTLETSPALVRWLLDDTDYSILNTSTIPAL